jgi:hypothetical protein
MGEGDLDWFGPLVAATQVDDAIKATLEEWMATYLRFVERSVGLEKEWLPDVKSFTISPDFDHYPEEQLPAVLIVTKEIPHTAMDGQKQYRATIPFGVGAFVSARDRASSDRLAKYYGAGIRALIAQQGDFRSKEQREKGERGIAVTTAWAGEKFGVHDTDTSKRTIGTAEVEFATEVRQMVQRLGGPKEPLPPPWAEPSPWPEVRHLTPVKIDPESA